MMKGIGKGRQAEGMDDRQSDRRNVRRKGKIMTGQTGKRAGQSETQLITNYLF